MNDSGATFNKLCSKSYVFQNKAKIMCIMCQMGSLNNFKKSNDFKQFTVWNGLSRRSK